ncbi:MAG: toprim domain-containing protein [Methylocystis sp.]
MESPARTLSSGLAEHVEAVCRHYLSNGRRCGNYWVVGDVNNHAGRSLYVRLKGPLSGRGARGRWADSATAEHGDLLDLIRARKGLTSFRDTLDEARRFLRAPRERTSQRRDTQSRERDTVALAKRIWAASRPIDGTPAEAYLRARKITADLHDAPLRYHPTLLYRDTPDSLPQRLPALLAAVTDNSGEITGIHRTFLDPERNTKANVASPRRSLGVIFGNGVRFGVIRDVAVVGEGIETVLSLKSALPLLPMVAALSATHLAAWEFPSGLRRLIIAADNDPAGRGAASKFADRAKIAGVGVEIIVSRGEDFNDDMQDIGLESPRR